MINQTKQKLRDGETVFGCFLRYPDPNLVEVLGYQGWDFLVFDTEHGSMQPADIENLVRSAELRQTTPLVRATTNAQPVILRLMDTGAQGLHVPWVNSPEDARNVVQSVKFQPQGRRGLAGSRAASFGQNVTWTEYVTQMNEQTLIVVQVEGEEAVNNLDAIVQVEGVDVVFIGPLDLSNSLGIPGRFDDPRFQDTTQRIADKVLSSNVKLGIMVTSAAAAREWQQRGARYITTTFEGLLRSSCRDYLAKVRP